MTWPSCKGPGNTTLVVWEGDADPQHFDIAVAKDNTEWESFLRKVQDNANGAPVLDEDACNPGLQGQRASACVQ